jgi:integrase/recombinase XerD
MARASGASASAPVALDDPESLAAYVARYRVWLGTRGYSPATIRSRGRLLIRFAEWCAERGLAEPREITKPILERYRRHLYYWRKADGGPLSFRSQAQHLVPIRMFFKWLARENLILSNPASELELPRPERRLPAAVLSADEAERLMAAPDVGEALGLRDRAILEVFYSTAIRRVELVGLKVFDVDWAHTTLMIRQGKGRKDRVVPLGERAKAWLQAYCDQVRPGLVVGRDEGVLFLNHEGRSLETRRLTGGVRTYIERAGIAKPGSCHLLRHTAATLMLEGGADIRFIQALLGHESLETTQIYTQVSIGKLTEIHAATHPGARLVHAQALIDAALEAEAAQDDED